MLSLDELQIIAKNHFSELQGPPKANVLDYGRADEFDGLILKCLHFVLSTKNFRSELYGAKSWFIILVIFLFPFVAHALSADLKQKFPYAVLTNDYDILNEIDLNSELDGVKHPPSFSTKAKGYIYWQCFPRHYVRISLEDLGSFPEDDPESDVKYNGENEAKLTIVAQGKHRIMHKYVMWGNYPVSTTIARFNAYLKLMHGEKNICIAGSYLEKETRKIVGEIETNRQQIYYWGFEKIKTAKGCEAYHRNGCHDPQANQT